MNASFTTWKTRSPINCGIGTRHVKVVPPLGDPTTSKLPRSFSARRRMLANPKPPSLVLPEPIPRPLSATMSWQ